MSVADAEKFVDKLESDPAFGHEFQEAESWDDALRLIREAGLDFTEDEFRAAILARTDLAGDESGDENPLLRAHW